MILSIPLNFSIYVYYENPDTSKYTVIERPNLTWIQTTNIQFNTLYKIMARDHKLELIIDTHVYDSRMIRLMAKRPAPIIVAYGYPDTSLISCYTHTTTKPEQIPISPLREQKYLETATPFCWTRIGDHVTINFEPKYQETTIGIMEPEKVTKKCVMFFNRISSRYKVKFLVCFRESTFKIPGLKNAEYLESTSEYTFFNHMDYTIDTFPYSGNGSTCASLYMGCPVLTYYDPKNKPHSNTTGIINICSGQQEYNFSTTKDLLRFTFPKFRDFYRRKQVRKAFIKAFDSQKFTKEFLQLISKPGA